MQIPEALLQQLVDLLRLELPSVARKQHICVAAVILGRKIDCGMDDLAKQLLKSQLPVGKLLAVLLRCESMMIQHLLEQPQQGDNRDQVRQFSDWIEHFNHLQDAVINAAEQNWRAAIDQERRSRVLAECRADWAEKGEVHLHNYFMEVPVTARVRFVSFDGAHHLHVKASEELGRVFSASGDQDCALISSPDRKYNIRAKAFQCKRMDLTLSIVEITGSMQERRSEVRVALDETVRVEVIASDGRFSAEMVDLSCGGAGLKLTGNRALRRNDRIGCRFALAGKSVAIDDVTVCWSAARDSESCVGISFQVNPAQRDTIYKYLFVLQQKIAGRIHHLGKPTWMK